METAPKETSEAKETSETVASDQQKAVSDFRGKKSRMTVMDQKSQARLLSKFASTAKSVLVAKSVQGVLEKGMLEKSVAKKTIAFALPAPDYDDDVEDEEFTDDEEDTTPRTLEFKFIRTLE
jgi:hypothetical protein